jgi:hypothetical protein
MSPSEVIDPKHVAVSNASIFSHCESHYILHVLLMIHIDPIILKVIRVGLLAK